jgi:phenylacetate-CoA ligase
MDFNVGTARAYYTLPVSSAVLCPTPNDQSQEADALRAFQRGKLADLLREVRASNPFYRKKFAEFGPEPDPQSLPFTTRADLEADQSANPPYGTNLTYPLDRYTRYCQTSGTNGRPMRCMDTPESWSFVARCWKTIFHAAGFSPSDRLLFAFSFGPFLGFWGAFDAAVAEGFLAIPAGGMSTTSRLQMIADNQVTVVLCTPTYALRMAEVAKQEGIDLPRSSVRTLIVAGEPGGSVPEIRGAIESAWGARVFDHTGMTELGPMSFECRDNPLGVHVIENEYIAEIIDPRTQVPLPEGQIGELVVTNLGRTGSPVIRYRTGDLVKITRGRCACGRCLARLEGGILGRVDDMFIVRGNNVFPTAVEAVLRRFPEIA